MGSISGIIGLMVCILFGLMVFVVTPSSNTTFNKIQNATNDMKVSTLNLTQDAPFIGTVTFPNVFSIFKGLGDLLITMSGAANDTFSSLVELPDIIRILLITLFGLMIVLAAIGFWKGVNQA